MELDVEMAQRAQKEKMFLFRWYGWRSLTISFGYSQRSLFEEYRTPFEKVLRPTGGGILIHGWDISFALATPSGVFRNFLHLYRFVSQTFVESFHRLGLKEVSYSRNRKGSYGREKLCWLYPTFGEVTYRDRKLVAAAVREFNKGNFLIHGSIFIAKNPVLLNKLFPGQGESFINGIITLSEIKIKKRILMQTFAENLFKNLYQFNPNQ